MESRQFFYKNMPGYLFPQYFGAKGLYHKIAGAQPQGRG
jgi:hypothetical protein